MKKPNENPSVNCDDIEGLLIQRHFDEITQVQSLLVEEHLKSCDQCRSYQKTLLSLQNSMQIGAEDKLTPHPAIRQRIVQRMKIQTPERIGVFARGWYSIRSIFEYRVPVYQALSGAVLIALIFFAVKQYPSYTHQKPPELQSVAQMEMPIPAQMAVIENLEIIKGQKIGQNVKEDTTLTRFIVSTM